MDDALTVAKLVGTVAALLGVLGVPSLTAFLVRSAFPDQRERLHAEIERKVDLLGKLPEDSKAHTTLQTSIDEDVRRLVTELSEARRDPMTFVIGLVMFLVGAVGGVGAWWLDSWWWRVPVWGVASVLVLVGLFGMWMGGQHARRDEKGNPIPNDADSAADSAGGSELEATQAAQDRPEVDDRS